LEELVDAVVEKMERAQGADGYLNTYFQWVEPGKRWTNLRDNHELYCAGHLIEAAVAYFQATGKRKMLEVLCRYVDHIAATFGTEPGKKRGYCGHEEIELALVKLYHVTRDPKHLALAKYFIFERGQRPGGKHYFAQEAEARGEGSKKNWTGLEYYQADMPVREQTTAEGHAVRAMYLYCGMTDLALETQDPTLTEPLQALWQNVTGRRMYITGGVGSAHHGERFTTDYDLPNETAYCETCAAIGLAFWAQGMGRLTGEGHYIDVLERAIYNGALAGISLDGKKFFYVNPLESRGNHHRRDWFDCACCPPNIARLLASLSGYVYSTSAEGLYVHLYASTRASVELGGQTVQVEQATQYPWHEQIRLTISPERPAVFAVRLRKPGWCRTATVKVNGKPAETTTDKGYLVLQRTWKQGDAIELKLAMPVERLEASPAVGSDCGRVALQRGPLVYCVEEVDNGGQLNDLALEPAEQFKVRHEPGLLGGVTVLAAEATRRDDAAWGTELYRTANDTPRKKVGIIAVPYYAWDNRAAGEMLVWLRQG
jgi:DUF1680 family protein